MAPRDSERLASLFNKARKEGRSEFQGEAVDSGAAGPTASVRAGYDDEIDLIDYLAVLIRQRKLVSGACLLGLILPLSYSLIRPPLAPHRAEVNLLVETSPDPASGAADGLRVGGLRSYAFGRAVLGTAIEVGQPGSGKPVLVEEALEEAGLDSDRRRLNALEAMTDFYYQEGGLLSVAATHVDSAVAAGIANAYADAVVRHFRGERTRRVDVELAYLATRLAQVESQLRAAEDSLITFRLRHRGQLDDATYLGLERELSWKQRRLTSWSNVYDNLLNRQEAIRIEALKEAPNVTVLGYASSGDLERTGLGWGGRLGIGMAAGLVLGVFAAFVKEYVARAIREGRLNSALSGQTIAEPGAVEAPKIRATPSYALRAPPDSVLSDGADA